MQINSQLTLRILGYVSVVAWLGLIGVYWWAAERGFDVTDEAAYLLAYDRPDLYSAASRYNVVMHTAFGWLEPGIIMYRRIGVLMNVIFSLLFAAGFYAWQNTAASRYDYPRIPGPLLFAAVGIGTFTGLGTTPQTPAYNDLNHGFLMAAAGLTFFWLAGRLFSYRALIAVPLLIVTLFLDYQAKQPSAFLMALLIFGVITAHAYFQFPPRWRTRVIPAIALTGILIAVYILYVLRGYYIDYVIFILGVYYDNRIHVIPPLSWMVMFLASMFLLGSHAAGAESRRARIVTSIFVIFAILYFVYFGATLNFFRSGYHMRMIAVVPFFVMLAAAVLALGGAVIHRLGFTGHPEERMHRWTDLSCVHLFLFAIPFAGAFGTNNPLSMNLLMHVAFWIVLILSLLGYVVRFCRGHRWHAVMAVLVVFTAWSQAYNAIMRHPYRVNAPLVENTELITAGELPGIRGLYLEPEMAERWRNLAALVRETQYDRGDYVLALFDMPGAVYALGGVSPGTVWFFSGHGHGGDDRGNCGAVENTSFQERDTLILVSKELSDLMQQCLDAAGLNLAGGARYVGEIKSLREVDLPVRVYFQERRQR